MPMDSNATTFTSTITPYGLASPAHVPTPMAARAVPAIATTNAASAMLE